METQLNEPRRLLDAYNIDLRRRAVQDLRNKIEDSEIGEAGYRILRELRESVPSVLREMDKIFGELDFGLVYDSRPERGESIAALIAAIGIDMFRIHARDNGVLISKNDILTPDLEARLQVVTPTQQRTMTWSTHPSGRIIHRRPNASTTASPLIGIAKPMAVLLEMDLAAPRMEQELTPEALGRSELGKRMRTEEVNVGFLPYLQGRLCELLGKVVSANQDGTSIPHAKIAELAHDIDGLGEIDAFHNAVKEALTRKPDDPNSKLKPPSHFFELAPGTTVVIGSQHLAFYQHNGSENEVLVGSLDSLTPSASSVSR